VRLRGQPFAILKALLENPGATLSRDALARRLWPGADAGRGHALDAAVFRLRTALGDSAVNPLYVETVPGRGYRFIAPVVPEPAPLPVRTPGLLKRLASRLLAQRSRPAGS
jgi:DNA-binding winged helix-turn-helix (wHTH) protein